MKKVIFILSLALPFSNVSLANSFDQAACTMFMCAYGEEESGGCASAIADLKAIQGFKHGDFDCSRTKTKRLARMQACKEAPSDQLQEAVNKIGCKT